MLQWCLLSSAVTRLNCNTPIGSAIIVSLACFTMRSCLLWDWISGGKQIGCCSGRKGVCWFWCPQELSWHTSSLHWEQRHGWVSFFSLASSRLTVSQRQKAGTLPVEWILCCWSHSSQAVLAYHSLWSQWVWWSFLPRQFQWALYYFINFTEIGLQSSQRDKENKVKP